ncbi:hypothetical protein [Pseudoxanthomonas sp.]|uniref:hypothetical protein n=2 Tax=Pseudoxanthomonas sp. TaxID=1871049 RepID=UPI0025889F18|nr:hypothetical protein [Pseudoxanthomonas sp.]
MAHRDDSQTPQLDSLRQLVQASMEKEGVPRKIAAATMQISERTLDRRADIPKIRVGRRVYVPAWFVASKRGGQ